jgi:hypothetical protein
MQLPKITLFRKIIASIQQVWTPGREGAMSTELNELRDKILAFHPEIAAKSIDLEVGFDAAAGKYTVKLRQAGEEVGAYLEKQDAEECLAGKKCVNLAVLVTQLLTELEEIITPRPPG